MIHWYDNIPLISFVLLKFKCRECGERISWQYPLVEFFTGIAFMLLGGKFFVLTDSATWFFTFYYLTIVSALIVILIYDLLYLEIPSIVLWTTVGFAIFCNLLIDFQMANFNGSILNNLTYSGTLAAFVAFISFFLLSSLSREKFMGMGDAFLVILIGLVLGWPKILLGLFLAFAIGAICGIVLVSLKKKKMGSQIPFAPFLAVGAIISMLYYTPIVSWYLKFF
jgi:leader peptidase (prepilin peptidase)/N-methyltransferase